MISRYGTVGVTGVVLGMHFVIQGYHTARYWILSSSGGLNWYHRLKYFVKPPEM